MFKDSCVTQLTPWRATEESTSLPDRIFPVYVGSGVCVAGLDASGLQGLNHRVQAAYGSAERAGDLYIVRNGMIGDQLFEGCSLPLGYMEWELELDGDLITSANLTEKAVLWKRELLLDQAKVTTSMMFHNRLQLRISVWVPYGGKSPVVEIELKGMPYMAKPLERKLQAVFRLHVVTQTRQGDALHAAADMKEDELTLDFVGSDENYRVVYTLDNDRGLTPTFRDGRFVLEWKTEVGHDKVALKTVVGLGERIAADKLEEARFRHLKSWADFYAGIAEVTGLPGKEEYLLHNSCYLLRSGCEFAKGITIGAPFYQPWCWKASVFWDSHFVSDGLLRAGDKADITEFLDFLLRAMKPAGKPFPWMMHHNGQSTIPDDRDFAPLVIAAHAMTAIKAYEYGRDRALLESHVYPIVSRVSEFAAETLFRQVDERWIVTEPVSNDVVEDVAVEINQTYTAAWFLSVMKKTIEYAELLGAGEALIAVIRPIVDGFYLERDDRHYLHARDMSIGQAHGASWVPFLLYPTEALPFVDLELLRATRERYNFPDLYMEKQGDFQPWGNFMQASSDLRLGETEKGYATFADGLNFTFGAGMFSEVGPRQETVALPPYVTAHGNYIAVLFNLFVRDSIWDRSIGLFASLPEAWQGLSLRLRGVACIGGVRIENAAYEPQSVTARLTGDTDGVTLALPLPASPGGHKRDGTAYKVAINGEPYPFAVDGSVARLLLQGRKDAWDIEITAASI